MSCPSLKLVRALFSGFRTLVIDEISMVSSSAFLYIDRRLCEIFDNNLPFGNLNVIAIGDFFHLKPARGRYAFEDESL